MMLQIKFEEVCSLTVPFLSSRDQSIPAVESVASDERSSLELDYLSRLMEEHTAIEGSLVSYFSRLAAL